MKLMSLALPGLEEPMMTEEQLDELRILIEELGYVIRSLEDRQDDTDSKDMAIGFNIAQKYLSEINDILDEDE